jgi:hypothetical protein
METRTTTLSRRRINNMGSEYLDTFKGLQAVFTTWEGERLVGTITHFKDAMYPCVTFDDGTWARLDLSVELVVND